MRFDDILGHRRALAQIESAHRSGRMHHAWLFAGPDGVGKERVALRLAQGLLCPADDGPCRTCSTCDRIARHTHPDVLWMMPDLERVERGLISRAELDRSPSRELRISEVREMERRVRLPAHAGGWKVVILTPADRLNAPAQNALLKTLEEPPPNTLLLLVTSAEGALLPTIRSRSVRVLFAPLPPDVVVPRIVEETGCDEATARILATIAGGSLGQALELDADAVARRRELILSVREASAEAGDVLTSVAAGFAEDRSEAEQHLDLLALWYRDVLAAQGGVTDDALANADLLTEAREDAGRLPPREVLSRLDAVAEARRALARNVNPRLAVEAMLAGFHEVRA